MLTDINELEAYPFLHVVWCRDMSAGMRAISSVESPHHVPQGAWQENFQQSWRSSTARVQCYDGLWPAMSHYFLEYSVLSTLVDTDSYVSSYGCCKFLFLPVLDNSKSK